MEGDYTGMITIGQDAKPLNVILDTGSSTLAVDANKYNPIFSTAEKSTNLAQTDVYGDKSSFTGAVISTTVSFGSGASVVTGTSVSVAIAYEASSNMFGKADGIMGLAYQRLDKAYAMTDNSWAEKYSSEQVLSGRATTVIPCLMQLANEQVLQEKMAFYTKRSIIHTGDGLDDRLNQGFLVIGGGEEETDLYSGTFQIAAVLSADWYSTNLKAMKVGNKLIPVSPQIPLGMSSNSIVDSGTNSLSLGAPLLEGISSLLVGDQRKYFSLGIQGKAIPMSALDLATWPTISFVLQGITSNTDVVLDVVPNNYWQVDAPKPGDALLAITPGPSTGAILGLPLLNGYFTIFDGTVGLGVIKFAAIK
jgi:hypothetical protein